MQLDLNLSFLTSSVNSVFPQTTALTNCKIATYEEKLLVSFSHSNEPCGLDASLRNLDIWLNWSAVSLLQGHHHQDGEADGRAGGLRHRHSGLAALPAEDHEPLPAGELSPGAAGAPTCLRRLSAAKMQEKKSKRMSVAVVHSGNHSFTMHKTPQRLDKLQ